MLARHVARPETCWIRFKLSNRDQYPRECHMVAHLKMGICLIFQGKTPLQGPLNTATMDGQENAGSSLATDRRIQDFYLRPQEGEAM